MSTVAPTPHDDGLSAETVAEETADFVKVDAPWVEWVTRVGWAAKGVVYLLMGLAAATIVLYAPAPDAGSPQGALATVMERPGGRVLLLILAVGLLMYVAWRLLSVAMIAGSDLMNWLNRIGYTFSALFYLALAWTALVGVMQDSPPEDGNTVERLSRSLMDTTWGRILVGVAGVVTIVVGAFFVVRKAIMRSFADDLEGVQDTLASNGTYGKGLLVSGVVGWAGRGVVTILVGFFVTRAAIRFDPSEARGFDRALTHVARTDLGELLVLGAAVGLVLYGLYCLLSVPARCLEVER